MLCVECRKLPSAATDPASGRTLSGLPGWTKLRTVMCSGCGSLLQYEGATETMLRTLTRLARFGLGAETNPILKS